MFGIAITKEPIANENLNYLQFELDDTFFTITVDNIFARIENTENGFTIIETVVPFNEASKKYTEDQSEILSYIVINTNHKTIKICSPLILGRTLYYYTDAQNFFCSTHILIMKKLGVKIEENISVLPEFFVYRHVTPPQTLYKNIKKTIFGEELLFKYSKSEVSLIDRSTSISHLKSKNSDSNYSQEIEIMLTESMKQLKNNKSRVAVLLSGGLDSSLLFQLAKKIIGSSESFSTSYPFMNLDSRGDLEKKYSLSASEALKSKHFHIEYTTDDYLRGFIEAINSAEEPLHHLQSVMFYLLFKNGIDSQKCTVINGLGADGLFGLSIHNIIYLYENSKIVRILCKSKYSLFFANLLSYITGRDYNSAIELMKSLNINDLQNPRHPLWKFGAYGSEEWVMERFNVSSEDIIKERLHYIKDKDLSLYDMISSLDLLDDISSTVLIWDKLAQANDKRIYYPFLNKKIIEYSFTIPWNIKLKSSKLIIKQIAKSLDIPSFIIKRKKSGFGVQPKAWAIDGGVLEPLIPLCLKIYDELDIKKMQSTDSKKAMIFWNMLNYAIWKRLFIYNEPVSVLLEELRIQECNKKFHNEDK